MSLAPHSVNEVQLIKCTGGSADPGTNMGDVHQQSLYEDDDDDTVPIVDSDVLGTTTAVVSEPGEPLQQPTAYLHPSSQIVRTVSQLDDESDSIEANVVRLREGAAGCGGACRRDILSIFVLTLINLLNYMDRYSVAGVLKETQLFYGINDKLAGLIQTAFIISYMLLSPLFGYLGDRYTRKNIVAGGILFWSLATLASSFIPRHLFGLFLFMRALVGVGEASYSTIAPTIIADLFTKTTRTKALTLFYFAIPVGSGLGYIVGSGMASACHNNCTGDCVSCWQWALRFTPGLGVICTVLILLLVQEPERGAADESAHITTTSYSDDLKYIMHNKSFLLSSGGFTCVAFVAGALALWGPIFIGKSIRVQPGSQADTDDSLVSLIFGVITMIAGIVGVATGTTVASKLQVYTPRADPLVCAFGMLTCAPFLYFTLCLASVTTPLTWVLILIGETLLCLNWAITTDMLLYVVIPTRRSSAAAVQILMSHILGDAGSPFLVGIISDAIAGSHRGNLVVDHGSLQYALFMTCFVCVIGGAFYLFTSLFIVEDRKRAEAIIRGGNVTECDTLTAPPRTLRREVSFESN